MALYPDATWRNSPNHGSLLFKAIGVILHVEQGTEQGTCAVFSQPSYQASAHFGIAKDGHIDQFVDTNTIAWAQAAGNSSYFSIETEGYTTEPLTDAQVVSFAKLYAWLQTQTNAQFGFTIADAPSQPGLGWHGMGGAAWGGHLGCPGDLRKAQRQQILDLAKPKGVTPMYNPPLQVVAELDCPTGGVWCLGPDGSIFAWGGAPYLGGCNGKSYFVGRTAARLNLVDGKYQIVATSGETYGPGF